MTTFSNFDVFIITRELDELLSKGKINNIYQIEDLLIIKINTKINETKNLIIKNDARLNLTNYNYPIPKFPSQFTLSLRKFLRNRKISSIYQYNFDRIIIFELPDNEGGSWKFIIELFNKGNFLILDENNIVKMAKIYRRFKDRDVLANKSYEFPKIKGDNFLNIVKEDFFELFRESKEEIIRIIARKVNISGLYSEEICLRAGIDKSRLGLSLNEEEKETLFKSLKNLRNQLMFGDINAQIIIDNKGENLYFTPFKLELLKNYKTQDFKSFNDAVDNYFSKIDYDQLEKPHDKKIDRDLLKFEKVLTSQEEYLAELKEKKVKFYTYGDYIYNNFNNLENLFSTILNAKSKGYGWEDIDSKLNSAKKENYEGLEAFQKIILASKKLIIKIDTDEVSLDLTKSIGENANILYQKGKKIEKKINGTLLAIQKSKDTLEKLKSKKENQIDDINFLIKTPKKKWYEKYRWFYTSDNFLVIAGRDASSNEAIYKKHISPNDIIFHTNFHGSPLAIIKNPNNEPIPESSKLEAADFVASYSRAWKENWGVVDIFYVFPDQISKTPPSGEYIPKGSFMISGKKNFIRDAKTELIIRLEFDEIKQDSNIIFYPKIIYGPTRALQKLENPKLLLKPSKSGESKGKVAKKIKDYFYKSFDENFKKWIELLSLNELIFIIPSGKTIVLESD